MGKVTCTQDPFARRRYDLEISHQDTLVTEIMRNVQEAYDESHLTGEEADSIGQSMTLYLERMRKLLGSVYGQKASE